MFRSRFVHSSSLLIVHSSRIVPTFELKGSSLTFAKKYAAVKHKNLRGKDWKEVLDNLNNRCIPRRGILFRIQAGKRASRINSSAVVEPGVGCVGGIVGVGNVGIVVPGFVGIASPLERSKLDLSEGDENLSDSKE
ncbi:hypothetical protein R1sor_014678 [Riccia sorocarpa]|uniref:Ribosomal protein S1 n=1 Tax=Riccia sorocarpa TaxID=122646 RepID=A0ABD3HG68_9MARC